LELISHRINSDARLKFHFYMAENNSSDQNILLVKTDGSDTLKAVASIDKNGDVRTVEATPENADRFLKFNRDNREELAGILSDFNEGFMNKLDYELFQVRYGSFEKEKEALEEVLSLPYNAQRRDALKNYAVDPIGFTAVQPDEAARTVLLTRNKEGKMKVVSGGDETTGQIKTVDPTKENAAEFKLFDTNGNFFENFVKRFSEQSEHPTHSGFYAVTAAAAAKVAAFFENVLKDNLEDKVLNPYRVDRNGKIEPQEQGRFQPFDLNRLNFNDVEKLGVLDDKLTEALKAMAYGYKSKLMDINIEGTELQGKARLSIVESPDGSLKIQTHPWQEKPDFGKPFMGVRFSDKDIEQFQLTGNGNRVFDLEITPGGEKIPALVSIDRLTNRFEAVPLSDIQISPKLKGVELSQEQQEGLKAGKGVLVENMDKNVKEGEAPSKITRIVQYNAAEKRFDFIWTPEQIEKRQQERAAKNTVEAPDGTTLKTSKVDGVWVRPVQGGVTLTTEQFKDLCAGTPVWVSDMQQKPKAKDGSEQKVEATDSKGKKYDAFVWIDKDMGRVRHTTKHPDQIRAYEAKQAAKSGHGVKPAAGYQTQVAVNNDGKTNEATKHAQYNGRPMERGQTQSPEKRFEKRHQPQRQSPSAPKQGKGRSRG
jgi:hypothetical protein